jgi:hypothetical protein
MLATLDLVHLWRLNLYIFDKKIDICAIYRKWKVISTE